LHRWYTPGEAGDVDGDVTDVSVTAFKVTLTLNVNVGDYVMVGTATLSTGEIMRIVKIDTVTLTVVRGQFGTTPKPIIDTQLIYVIPRSEVSRIITGMCHVLLL
jgi:hypothetical protein